MKINLARIIYGVLIGWYLILITVHYFNQRPLWNDELCVFESIRVLVYPEIFQQPLLAIQQFPRVYLFIIQQIVQQYGAGELVLRFLPFLMMLAAVGCWIKIVSICWQEYRYKILFVMMWLASMPLIYYAAELKQYSADVLMVSIVVLGLVISRQQQYLPAWMIWTPFLGLFSYPVFFILLLVTYQYFCDARFNWQRLSWQAYVFGVVFFTVAGMVYWLDIRHSNVGYLQKDWSDYMISFQSGGDFLKTVGEGFNNLIARWFAERPKWIKGFSRLILGAGLMYLVVSWWQAFKSRQYRLDTVMTIAGALLVVHVLFGMLHKYPFVVPRTSLFYAPFLFVASIELCRYLSKQVGRLGTAILVLVGIILLVINYGIAYELIVNGDLGAQSVLFD